MTKYGMVIDLDKCVGCGACVAACISENLGPEVAKAMEEGRLEDLKLRTSVEEIEVGVFPKVRTFFYHNICRHCKNPPCVYVCPTGASYKNENGIVLINKDRCISCKYCIMACPFDARYMDELTMIPDKCTFCEHRLKEGKLPACVEACPTHARVFGELNELFVRAKGSGKHMWRGEGFVGGGTSVIYLTSVPLKPILHKEKPVSSTLMTRGREIVKDLGYIGIALVTAISVAMIVANWASRKEVKE